MLARLMGAKWAREANWEGMALREGVEAGKEAMWMRNFLSELGYSFPSASALYMYNNSAIAVAKNPEHHSKMKHLDLKLHWLRDYVEANYLFPVHQPTADMPADIMTKALPRVKVEHHRKLLGLV